MRRASIERGPKVRLLSPTGASLAAGVAAAPPGTIYLRSAKGGIVAPPSISFIIIFGRNEQNVHVAVGVGDRQRTTATQALGSQQERAARWSRNTS